MNLGIFFWFLYILAVVLSLFFSSPDFKGWARGALLYFALLGVLGYAQFGAAVHR